MKLAYGNMWDAYEEADLFLITTNSFIKRNGALVMGAGIAKQARDMFSGLDLALGQRIDHLGLYGLLISENYPERKLGAFQVKRHWKDTASLDIIEKSTSMLNHIAPNDGLQIHLNFPGIGNGKLNRKAVLPLLEKLSGSVTIWEYEEKKYEFEEDHNWMPGHPMYFGDK